MTPEDEDIINALGANVPLEEITDPIDRSRVFYAQSQRLDAESDNFLEQSRKKAVNARWRRRQFYLDQEEGMSKPQGYTERDSSDDESESLEEGGFAKLPPHNAASPQRPGTRSRSPSKVRFDDSAIDTDYETRSNASSRSIPVNERWAGVEFAKPEFDVGKDILYHAVQEGFNELLDGLFKPVEDAAMEAQSTRAEREKWADLLAGHKQKRSSSTRRHKTGTNGAKSPVIPLISILDKPAADEEPPPRQNSAVENPPTAITD